MSDGLYIGRVSEPATLRVTEEPYLLDPNVLTRHAVCFGMTGSGKTGLCVTLLEELTRAGVPVIIIDPKGDMANLALAFENLEGASFSEWVDEAKADDLGLTKAELGEKTAETWKKGLASWELSVDDVNDYVSKSHVQIYTPGSRAGTPVNVLGSLAAPSTSILSEPEALAELVASTISGVLALVGVQADPAVDPAHIVMSQVLMHAWSQQADLTLETLILQVMDPPFERAGVFPIDTFFPKKDRMKLAMRLNGLVAAPSFAPWRDGEAIDIEALLQPVDGKTPIRVFYLAHLDEPQRQFFSAMLLSQVVAWSRQQGGTSRLRALVYFDEVYGYLPPYPKNPPTKTAVLTLMKQARAVGVGTMLVTQNPVDIDYAALSNAGLWMIGRLQTEQDRDRVVEGLLSANSSMSRAEVEGWLGNLPSRTFVIKNAKEDSPRLVHSRWAMTFLRGPLTPLELGKVCLPRVESNEDTPSLESAPKQAKPLSSDVPPPPPPLGTLATTPATASSLTSPAGYTVHHLDAEVAQSVRFRAGLRSVGLDLGSLEGTWFPALYVRARLRFDEGRDFAVNHDECRVYLTVESQPEFFEFELPIPNRFPGPPANGSMRPWPSNWGSASQLKTFKQHVARHIFEHESTVLIRNRFFKQVIRSGESKEAFIARVDAAAHSWAMDKIAKHKDKLDREVTRWETKRAQLLRDLERKRVSVQGQTATEVISAAETLYGLFVGGRKKSLSSVARRRQQTARAQHRVERLEEKIVEYEVALEASRDQFQAEIAAIESEAKFKAAELEEVVVGLEKDDIEVQEISVLWIPL